MFYVQNTVYGVSHRRPGALVHTLVPRAVPCSAPAPLLHGHLLEWHPMPNPGRGKLHDPGSSAVLLVCPVTIASLHSPLSALRLRSLLHRCRPPNHRTTTCPRILCIVSRQSPVPLPPDPRLANAPLCRRAEPFRSGARVLRIFLHFSFFFFVFAVCCFSPLGGLTNDDSDLRPQPVAQSLLGFTTTLLDSLGLSGAPDGILDSKARLGQSTFDSEIVGWDCLLCSQKDPPVSGVVRHNSLRWTTRMCFWLLYPAQPLVN